MANLLLVLQKERVNIELDKVTWNGTEGGAFKIRHAYKKLFSSSTS